MKKFIVIVLASLLVGVGLGYSLPHGAKTEGPVGAGVEINSDFTYGFTAGSSRQMSVDSSGNLSTSGDLSATDDITATDLVTAARYATGSVGSSSSSPSALGSAAAGYFVVGTGTPATRLGLASTTAVTANSVIMVQQETRSPMAGVTCNTTLATSSSITTVAPDSGFVLTVGSIPATNPQCWSYWIIN
jgi:hypothetical protein